MEKTADEANEAGRIFEEAVAKMEAEDDFTYDAFKRSVFVIFDAGDRDTAELLSFRAKDDEFLFELKDCPAGGPSDDGRRSDICKMIRQSNTVIVAIGKNACTSKEVDWEIREAVRQNKAVIGVMPYWDEYRVVPKALVEHGCRVMLWDSERLTSAIRCHCTN